MVFKAGLTVSNLSAKHRKSGLNNITIAGLKSILCLNVEYIHYSPVAKRRKLISRDIKVVNSSDESEDDQSESEENDDSDENSDEDESDDDAMDTGLNLEDDEAIALKLLNSW